MVHAGHKYWLEQSENPSGPYITSYEVVEETRGVWLLRLHRNETTNQFQSKTASKSMIVLNDNEGIATYGDRSFSIPYQFRTSYDEWLRYAPEYVVLKATQHALTLENEKLLEGTPHYVLAYVRDGLKHKLYINKYTRLLYKAEIESYLPYDIFNYPWGKFTTIIKYSLHWLYEDGIRYPAQWDSLENLFVPLIFPSNRN